MDPDLTTHLTEMSKQPLLPSSHQNFLWHLRDSYRFFPKVCYDIGSCVLHWTNGAKQVWPDAKYVLFDAFQPAEFLYTGYDYHIGVLSDEDNKTVKFYQNNLLPGGNSYYREVGCMNGLYFPPDQYKLLHTSRLDNVVKSREFPLPDLIKIDVQGAELDILKGGIETLKHAKVLIVEMQHTNYNDGAPKVDVTKPFIESLGWRCIAEKFSDNGPDADYCFVNTNLLVENA